MSLHESEISAILDALRQGARATHGVGRGAYFWGFRAGNFFSEVADFDPQEQILDEAGMRAEIARYADDFRKLL